MEVDEKAQRLVGCPEIRQDLRLVNRENRLDRLEFDDHGFFDQKIETVGIRNFEILVFQRQEDLGLAGNPTQPQFVLKRPLVSGFKKPGAQFAVHLDGRSNDFLGDVIQFHNL